MEQSTGFSRNWRLIATLLLLALLSWFPLFQHLDFLPILNYDEGRQAVNAMEMLESGNIWTTTYRGDPDLWSTKPPLLIWIQALSIRFLGANELAVRLPSALAGFATVFLLFGFLYRRSGSSLLGFLAGISLLTFQGYCDIHGTRTGDFDALLTLFTTGFLLFLFRAIEAGTKARYLIPAGIFFFGALMTKGIPVLMFGPAILVYLLLERKVGTVFTKWPYYLALGVPVLLWVAVLLFRDAQLPGYLKAMWENDMGGRFTSAQEDHNYSFNYYFSYLLSTPLIILVIPAFLFRTEPSGRRLLHFCGITAVGFLLILMLAETKLPWYLLPIMPLAAILISYSSYEIIQRAIRPSAGILLRRGITTALLVAFFMYPYQLTMSRIFTPKEARWEWQDARYGWMMKSLAGKYEAFSVVKKGYNSVIDFYELALPETAINNRYQGDYGYSEKLLLCGEDMIADLQARYEYEILVEESGCLFVKILGER